MNFVAIDFETANGQKNSACALGLVIVENGEVTLQRYWLIQPPTLFFDPHHVAIHGITEEDVEGEPTFDMIWPEIQPFLEGRIIVAHNAGFDIGVLKAMLDTYGIPYPRNDYYCTVTTARKTWPDLPSYKLNAMADMLNVQFRHHHALDDALVSAYIMIAACRKLQLISLKSLARRFKIVPGRMRPNPPEAIPKQEDAE